MSIDKITSGLSSGIEQIRPVKDLQAPSAGGKVGQPGKESFGDMLAEAIKDVDRMQTEADGKITGLMTGTGGVTPHDAMLALEKADIAFQLMNQIRTKIVRAYEEVMRTQV